MIERSDKSQDTKSRKVTRSIPLPFTVSSLFIIELNWKVRKLNEVVHTNDGRAMHGMKIGLPKENTFVALLNASQREELQ